jgi:two-component system, OmpR family, sensor histidine kinase CpxA
VRSLFFRIFIWFWVAVVILALTFAGTILETHGKAVESRRLVLREWTALYADAAAAAYEQSGIAGLQNLRRGEDSTIRRVYFFDGKLRELLGRRVPAGIRALAKAALSERAPEASTSRSLNSIACRTRGPTGTPFVLVVRFRPGAFPSPELSSGELMILIPALLLVAGLVCFWLSRYLTQPVSSLRALTRRFADGGLNVRVNDFRTFHRSEELEGLARDFNLMAERIQALLDRQKHLLWMVSHELRTPLTRVALAIGLIRQRSAELAPKEFARIDREVERVNDLIGRILTLAQLEKGMVLERNEPVDVAALVREVAADAALESDDRSVSVLVCGVESAQLRGNRKLSRMAIENVLRNAVRHTRRSSSVILEILKSDRTVSVVVRDEGPGVPARDLPRLFEPFFRTADARASDPGGAGLGLAITRRVVERHGGSITARNHETAGLVITMNFPLGSLSGVRQESHSAWGESASAVNAQNSPVER